MVGTRLSHFKLLDKLGEGGMGVVYRAEDTRLGRQVAVKVLPPELVGNEERRLRFIREARLAASVTHPNIATIHEIDEDSGVVFIAMELVEGSSLKEIGDLGRGPLDSREALRIAVMVAEGLCRAHEARIVHRDLKPENIMVAPAGQVKILDFGLAKPYGAQGNVSTDDQMQTISTGVTRDGRILGTVAYMSPEQARGQPIDSRSDIFSLGILVYEMVTAANPFRGETITDTLSAILRDPPPPIARFNREVPAELERVLGRCLEKRPEHRYETTDELLRDLVQLERASGSDSLPKVSLDSERPRKVRRPFPLIVAVGGLAVLALALVVPRLLPDPALSPVLPIENSLAVLPFENLQDTDDPKRLGQILQELVISDLSGVREVKIFSSQRLFDIQKQLGRGPKSTIDRELAGRIAARAGASTMLTGSLTRFGDRWVLTSQLVDVDEGTVIQSERIDGQDLYAMVDDLTPLIRDDLGLARPGAATKDVAVAERTSTSIEAYRQFLEGLELLNALEFDGAARAFETAVTTDPSFGEAHLKLALARWWERGGGDGDDAEGGPAEALERLLSGDVKLSDEHRSLSEATLALVRHDYETAHESFARLAERYPDNKEAWYGLGEAIYHGGHGKWSAKASGAFERAVELDPGFRLGYFHLLEIYERQQRYDAALDKLTTLIEQDPGNPNWHQEWARLTATSRDEKEAGPVIEECLNKMPDEKNRRELLVKVAGAFGDRGAKSLLQLTPGDVEALSLQCITEIGLGHHARAEQLIRTRLAQGPDHVHLYRLLSHSLAAQGRWAEAAGFAEDAVSMDASHRSHVLLSWILVAGELDVPRGAELARRALGITPALDDGAWHLSFIPSAEHSLGLAHLKRGQLDQAVTHLERAKAERPERGLIREHLREARSRQAPASG